MLELTAAAQVNDVKFDGVDLFIANPYTSIDANCEDVKRPLDKIRAKGLAIGSLVAAVRPPAGGGSAIDGTDTRKKFLSMVEKACRNQLRDFRVRPSGVVRIEAAAGVPDWAASKLDQALKTVTDALRHCTIDFDVAQNDATVKGMGSHDKTGRHCMAKDPNGKLDITHDAVYWLRDGNGVVTRVCKHLGWLHVPERGNDGKQQTWNDILSAMIEVRDAHGWQQHRPKRKRATK